MVIEMQVSWLDAKLIRFQNMFWKIVRAIPNTERLDEWGKPVCDVEIELYDDETQEKLEEEWYRPIFADKEEEQEKHYEQLKLF